MAWSDSNSFFNLTNTSLWCNHTWFHLPEHESSGGSVCTIRLNKVASFFINATCSERIPQWHANSRLDLPRSLQRFIKFTNIWGQTLQFPMPAFQNGVNYKALESWKDRSEPVQFLLLFDSNWVVVDLTSAWMNFKQNMSITESSSVELNEQNPAVTQNQWVSYYYWDGLTSI